MNQVVEDGYISISLSAKGIGEAGMLGIGWGGLTMSDAKTLTGSSGEILAVKLRLLLFFSNFPRILSTLNYNRTVRPQLKFESHGEFGATYRERDRLGRCRCRCHDMINL